ncbi:MAG TPA: bifunctional hydroxymethylpyrimidine kinase/phosphomethylpyrimidine kinase [Actinobacteria bacterium]|nr:bifunctional hydroxymethylpyrimidine kinase/phosphomethylpyrimidine kinase [Actinomycetota bacterium]
MEIKKLLVIGGSDPSGGAGIQVDRFTAADLGVFPYSVLTAVIAQNSSGVSSIEKLSKEIISKQLEAVFADTNVDAIKTGMLASRESVEVISNIVDEIEVKNFVIDPVFRSSSGTTFLSASAISLTKVRLFAKARIITPNIPEAERLAGFPIKDFNDVKKAAKEIKMFGSEWVLIKGGHLPGGECIDFLFDGIVEYKFSDKKINKDVRGTGCIFSTALASQLALGQDVPEAAEFAKKYVGDRIAGAICFGKNSFQTLPSFISQL